MTEIGFASDFGGQGTRLCDVKTTLEKIAKAGFTHVHWCHEWDGDYYYSRAEMELIKSWFDEYALKAKSLHASKGSRIRTAIRKDTESRKDFTSANEYSRRAGVELIKNRLDLAQVLGATEIVLHMYVPYMTFQEEPESEEIFYRQAFQSLDELEPYARERRIRICLETMLEAPAELQYEEFDRLFERYDKDYLGICWDTGHTHIILNERQAEFGRRYQDRIFSVHLNDNLGGPRIDLRDHEDMAGSCDLHWIPGEGTVDWEETAEVLAASSYDLPIVMELNGYDNQDEFLRRSYEAGIRLTEMITEKRQQRRNK